MCVCVSVASKVTTKQSGCSSSSSLEQVHRSFVLTVQAADMYGSPEGNSATATVFIDILDVNDNIPTLEKDEVTIYTG